MKDITQLLKNRDNIRFREKRNTYKEVLGEVIKNGSADRKWVIEMLQEKIYNQK